MLMAFLSGRRLPLRNAIGSVENFDFRVYLFSVFFFSIGLRCYHSSFVLHLRNVKRVTFNYNIYTSFLIFQLDCILLLASFYGCLD